MSFKLIPLALGRTSQGLEPITNDSFGPGGWTTCFDGVCVHQPCHQPHVPRELREGIRRELTEPDSDRFGVLLHESLQNMANRCNHFISMFCNLVFDVVAISVAVAQ